MPTTTAKQKEKRTKRAQHLREEFAQNVRDSIETKKILAEVQQLALGGADPSKWPQVRMKAVEILLDKTIPNLASIKHETDAKSVVFLLGDTPPDVNDDDSVPASG